MDIANTLSPYDHPIDSTGFEPPAASKRRREPGPRSFPPSKRHKPSHVTHEYEAEDEIHDATGHCTALSHEDYTVAWICALHLEMAAARAMLDEVHETLPTDWNDSNSYVMGSIRQHNVVIACLPTNQYGIVNAASVATNLQRTFESIRITLMVGIGGGAPGIADLRLGDVVVGTRVMQSDLGKFIGDDLQRTAFSRLPPLKLSTLVSNLRSKHEFDSSRLPEIMSYRFGQHPEYCRPSLDDCLFQANYEHSSPTPTCDRCDRQRRVARSVRKSELPEIHYGAIASASNLVRNAVHRDRIARELDIICFEMEAAGIVDTLPCLVIRGISDYCDSHKDKYWQRYAAAAAAAYARELLEECRVVNACARPAPGRDPQEPKRQRLLKALMFDKIKARERNIEDAHSETCRWLLEHPDYKAWLDPTQLSQHNGFLWIRGKPGAGKSTILKFALSEFKSAASSKGATASFFFNARGEYLERSVVGMYRSLLYYLLQKFRSLPVELDETDTLRLDEAECPPLEILKDVFRTAVLSLGGRSLTCFVDALDESDEQQVIDMIRFFEDLAESTTQRGIKFRVCFSSRHYPYIDIRNGKQLILEDLPQHRKDMENYVKSQLRISDSDLAEKIRHQVLEKAAGVFLWVVLVVDILNKEYRNGAMALEKRFAELPDDLSELFKNILQRDHENMSQRDHDELLLCVLWILYAKRPLTPQEYEHALWSGLHPKGTVDSVVPDSVARGRNGSTERYIISSSKGLAELTRSKMPIVQFIHESVRDFLIKDNGLVALWPNHGLELFNQESLGHEELKLCCRAYMDYYWTQQSDETRLSDRRPKGPKSKLRRYPLLQYAAQNILHHANVAATTVVQRDFLSEFPLSDWTRTIRFVEKSKKRHYKRSADLIYVLADRGCAELVRARPVSYEACPGVRSDERFRYPLFAALANGNITTAVALLGLPTSIRDGTDITRGLAVKNKVRSFERTKLTPLSWAAFDGLVAVVRILIQKGAPIEEADNHFETPLLRAARHEAVTKLLIEAGADVTTKTSTGETPLHRASRLGDVATVRLLLNAGAEINAKDSDGSMPLHLASREGYESVAIFLVEAGANIDARDNNSRTPLHEAGCNGKTHMATVARCLIEKGAEVDTQDNYGYTPLHVASSKRNEELVKTLIESGAEINQRDSKGRTPLHEACRDADDDGCTAELLIHEGADINACDNVGHTPLAHSRGWRIQRLLIEAGADIETRDFVFGHTPLLHSLLHFKHYRRCKCDEDHTDWVKDLVKRGADVYARESNGTTPLSFVRSKGFSCSPGRKEIKKAVKAAARLQRAQRSI